MKPHIRLARTAIVSGWWLCLTRSAAGRVVYYKPGLGRTVADAYADWARINDVNQNS